MNANFELCMFLGCIFFDISYFRRRKSKRDDDPDWVPDSDVEEELSAMGGGPWVTRQSRKYYIAFCNCK